METAFAEIGNVVFQIQERGKVSEVGFSLDKASDIRQSSLTWVSLRICFKCFMASISRSADFSLKNRLATEHLLLV